MYTSAGERKSATYGSTVLRMFNGIRMRQRMYSYSHLSNENSRMRAHSQSAQNDEVPTERGAQVRGGPRCGEHRFRSGAAMADRPRRWRVPRHRLSHLHAQHIHHHPGAARGQQRSPSRFKPAACPKGHFPRVCGPRKLRVPVSFQFVFR